jgi:hypothetical protein
MTPQELRTLLNQINDLMTIGGATLTERQEDILYAALKALLNEA